MIGTFYSVVIDAPDHRALAQFYVDLTRGELRHADDIFAFVRTGDGWRLAFQLVPDHVPPQWPQQSVPQQMHLDFQVPDRQEAAQFATGLGAKKIGSGESFEVMADPAGHPFCLCTTELTLPIQLFAVNIDCPDPPALAAFYQELLGMQVKYSAADGAWVGAAGDEGGPQVLFQRVADYHRPEWPDPAHPQQVHLDVLVTDIEAAQAQALAIGATRLPGEGESWRVFADPEGHPFCLVWGA